LSFILRYLFLFAVCYKWLPILEFYSEIFILICRETNGYQFLSFILRYLFLYAVKQMAIFNTLSWSCFVFIGDVENKKNEISYVILNPSPKRKLRTGDLV